MTSHPAGMPRYPGSAAGASSAAEETTDATAAPTRRFSLIRKAGWIFFAILCFVFFTVSKLPKDRINAFIIGNISTALASRGISFDAKSAELNLLFGPSYDMRDVTLTFPPPAKPAHIDQIEISPSIFPLFLGKVGGTLHIRNGKGSFRATASYRGSHVSLIFDANRFDIGSIALLKLITNVAGSAIVSGHGNLSADFNSMTETNADIQLNLSKIVIDSQPIQGFTIPRLAMSEGKVDLSIDHGRGMLRTLQLGKPDSPTDDIRAMISGDILFGKMLATSTCDLRANFSFSQALLKSFSLLGAILAAGRQPDGSFSYKLVGPLLSPNPIPAGGH